MKKMTIVWTLTLLVVVGSLTTFGFKLKKEKGSNIMEKSLVTQAEKYMGLYPGLFPTKGNSFTVGADELKQDGYDAKLDSGCDGYVVITNESSGFKYNAYVKCPDYMTDGYENENGNSPIETSNRQ